MDRRWNKNTVSLLSSVILLLSSNSAVVRAICNSRTSFYRATQCVCLCLSVESRSSTEMAERIELVFGIKLPSKRPTLCYKEIRVPPKIRILTFLRNFVLDRIVNRTCRRSNLLTTLTTVDRNALTPLLRFPVDLLYNFFLQHLTRF